MAVQSYRDRVRPSLIDTSIPSNGKSQTAQQLSAVLKDFELQGRQVLTDISTEQGRREGAEAGRTDHPGFRTGMASLTAYGRAFNDASTRSFAIKTEADADENANRLEAAAGTDPEKFRLTFGARRDAAIKNAPEEARAVLAEIYDRRMAGGVQRLQLAQQGQIREQARADVSEGIVRSTDRLAQLRASNDPALFEQANEEEIKVDMLIEAAVNDGTLSAVEGAALRVDSTRRATQQVAMYRFKNELDNPYGDPVSFIENLRNVNKTSNALPPDEEEKLLNSMMQELQEHNALARARVSASDLEQKQRWETGDRVATNAMLEGRLTANRLSQMIEDDELDPSVARTLYNELQSGGGDKPDDTQERFRVETTLLKQSEEDIARNTKLSWKTRRELTLKLREEMNGWKGTQQAKEAADRIDRALNIPPGMNPKAMTPEELQKRDRALTEWYGVVDTLPPDERQAKAIEMAEQTINKVIRSDAAKKAAKISTNIAKLQADLASGKFDEAETKDAEKALARQQALLRVEEAKAK
jgi:hypothetical protein